MASRKKPIGKPITPVGDEGLFVSPDYEHISIEDLAKLVHMFAESVDEEVLETANQMEKAEKDAKNVFDDFLNRYNAGERGPASEQSV